MLVEGAQVPAGSDEAADPLPSSHPESVMRMSKNTSVKLNNKNLPTTKSLHSEQNAPYVHLLQRNRLRLILLKIASNFNNT